MTMLLWARFVLLASLVVVVSSFVWLQLSDVRRR